MKNEKNDEIDELKKAHHTQISVLGESYNKLKAEFG